jgi:hypothetical protein
MTNIEFKIQGILEIISSNKIFMKLRDRFKLNSVFEEESDDVDEITFKEAEIQPLSKEAEQLEPLILAAATLPSPLEATIKPVLANWDSQHVTLEKYGGLGYYKLIEEGLIYKGSLIESTNPIFDEQDTGKTFCGLFAHQNSLHPESDEFFPGIIGSRYALIIEVLDAYRIKLNFEFNGQSNKGYIFHDNSFAFRSAMNSVKYSRTKTIELQDRKTYVIPEYEKTDLSRDFFLIAKTGSNLKIGVEDYFQWSNRSTKRQAGSLFDFGGNSVTIGFRNVNFLPPHRQVNAAQLFSTSLFRSTPNKGQTAKVAVINMNSTLEVNAKDARYNQVGFGYGFMYSSEPGNYVIGKDITQRGPGFMDFKANFGGGLFAVFENIKTDFKDEESFATPRIKVMGRLEDNIFTITSGHTIYQIFTYDFGEGNVSHLLHFDRFTFVINGKNAVINASQFRVRPFGKGQIKLRVRDSKSVYAKAVELHAGDQLIYQGQAFQIVEKTRTYVTEWNQGEEDVRYAMCLKLDKALPVADGYLEFEIRSIGESLNNGQEKSAYLIYKANYEFRTYMNTKFEDREVLSSDPVGHLSYNHKEITLWAKNFKHNGFYRQSLSKVGKSNGYTLINCSGFEGQFKPDAPVRNSGEMSQVAVNLIQEIESIV